MNDFILHEDANSVYNDYSSRIIIKIWWTATIFWWICVHIFDPWLEK